MTTTGSVFSKFIDRLNDASSELAAEAERLGVSRAETAAALAAEVQHAATRDAELEAQRDLFRADLARYRADVAEFNDRRPAIGQQLGTFMDRLAALADEVTVVTDEPVALDERGAALHDLGRRLGEPAFAEPRNFEDLVQAMSKDPAASLPMVRLLLRSRQGCAATVEALAEATANQRRSH